MTLSPEVRRGGGLPFGQFVSQWVCDPRYSTNLRTLYSILVTYADIGARDTKRGKPYRKELASQLGVSVRTLDRTVLEGECAGLLWVEKRPAPGNPKLNDASIYHLRDAEFWRGEWADPLKPGQTAEQAAAAVVEARIKAKREAGIQPKGGVPKGTKRAKPQRASTPASPPSDGGGGDIHDARGSDMGDARVATSMSPNVYIPVENPDREPVLPDAVGKSAGGFARTGAPQAAGAESGPEPSGSAASKTLPSQRSPRPKTVRTAPRGMPPGGEAVVAAIPPEVCRPGTKPWVGLRRAIADLLTGNPSAGIPPRTPDQVIARMNRVWYQGRGPERSAPGYTSATDSEGYAPIANKSSWLAAAILNQDCPDPRCEDGVLLPEGHVCEHCQERRAEARAVREAAAAAAALLAVRRRDDEGRPSQAREAVATYVAAAAAEEARVQRELSATGVWGTLLDHRVALHMARWRDRHPAPAPVPAGAEAPF